MEEEEEDVLHLEDILEAGVTRRCLGKRSSTVY